MNKSAKILFYAIDKKYYSDINKPITLAIGCTDNQKKILTPGYPQFCSIANSLISHYLVHQLTHKTSIYSVYMLGRVIAFLLRGILQTGKTRHEPSTCN